MKKKVVLFVRVSTENQELDSQIEALKKSAYADGYTDDDIIIIAKKESGVKLKEAEREGLNDLKRVIERNIIDGVYLYELSRLSRDPITLYSLRDKIFKEEKIQLKCLKPSFTLLEEPDRTKFDTMGSLVFSIFGCFAEQEVIEKKERFHRGREQKALEGKFGGGRIPYGYAIDEEQDNLIVIDEEEASTIRTIFDMYESGYSQPRIALELQERGVKYRTFYGNKRSEEKDFTYHFIGHILGNELLTGHKLKGKKSAFERSYPPIITEAQFERCREIANARNKTYGKVASVYYAGGILVCPECGHKMHARVGSYVYHCNHSISNAYTEKYASVSYSKDCSNKATISINALDSLLWHLAIERESRYILGNAMDDIAQFEERINVIQDKIDAILPRLTILENKRKRIMEAYLEGYINKEIKARRIVELDDQKLDVLKQKIDFEKDIEYFKERIEDIRRLYSSSGESPAAVSEGIDNLMAIQEKIGSTENDEERSRLVHKHIKKVCFVNRVIPFSPKTKWIATKETEAKYVRVTYFDETNCYFYLLCNNGNCNKWINSDEQGNVLDELGIEIQQRFVNVYKGNTRIAQNKRWEDEFKGMYDPKDLFIRGFDAMAIFLCMSSAASVRRRYAEGFFEDSITVDENGVHIMDAAKALEIMKASKNAWIKKILDNFYKVRKKKGKK